jgi:hypothetical protein
MMLGKYKYYFRKPRSAITKDILYWLLVTGAVCIAATSPYFGINLWRGYWHLKKYPKKRITDTFYILRKQGLINVEKQGPQIYINLTKRGKEKAGFLQINDLKISRPKKWDKKWRLVIFDIAQLKKAYREAFRGKIKELGFRPLQKSVWLYPYDCRSEIDVLKEFFGLSDSELRLILAEEIGNDKKMKEIFRI